MGICSSCESTSVATAKVVLQDGKLEEFSYPVKASYVLSKDPDVFICNSDEMDFDGVVSAIHDDDELQLGSLYFALPKNKLRHPLQAEEMAALAVKANNALLNSRNDEKCRCRKKSGYFGGEGEERSSARVAFVGSAAGRRMKSIGNGNGNRRNRNGNGRMKKKMFVANLSIIPE